MPDGGKSADLRAGRLIAFAPADMLGNPIDEQTLDAIAEWELQEDMRRAEQRAVSLGLLWGTGLLKWKDYDKAQPNQG